ncbi:TetR/AcrR family transcriptional regulator, partial [Streptomyces sp. FH025]|nr:TetR/AcrR family transcriptional regulator [Streptomyces sp. FH025]
DLEVWQASYARLDATTHPNIAATARLLTADMPLSGYPYALELLLDAAEARLARFGTVQPNSALEQLD